MTRSRKMDVWYAVGIALAAVTIGVVVAVSTGHVDSSAAFLAAAAALLGWIVWLLFRAAQAVVHEPAAESAVATGRRRKELEREKQALLKALKELEFDHEMGKVSDKDFREIGAQYRGRAVRVMRQLDEAGGEYRALIERELAARRKPKPASAGKPELESKPEPKPAPGALLRCASCGTTNDADADFCKKCGTKLARAEAAP